MILKKEFESYQILKPILVEVILEDTSLASLISVANRGKVPNNFGALEETKVSDECKLDVPPFHPPQPREYITPPILMIIP